MICNIPFCSGIHDFQVSRLSNWKMPKLSFLLLPIIQNFLSSNRYFYGVERYLHLWNTFQLSRRDVHLNK